MIRVVFSDTAQSNYMSKPQRPLYIRRRKNIFLQLLTRLPDCLFLEVIRRVTRLAVIYSTSLSAFLLLHQHHYRQLDVSICLCSIQHLDVQSILMRFEYSPLYSNRKRLRWVVIPPFSAHTDVILDIENALPSWIMAINHTTHNWPCFLAEYRILMFLACLVDQSFESRL